MGVRLPSAARGNASERLFVRYRLSRDAQAHRQLVERYRPFARKVARRYAGRRIRRGRLDELADHGLRRTIESFEPSRGAEFLPLAARTILREVKGELETCEGRLATNDEATPGIAAARQYLSAARGRTPAVAELAEYLERSLEEVVEALEDLPAAGR